MSAFPTFASIMASITGVQQAYKPFKPHKFKKSKQPRHQKKEGTMLSHHELVSLRWCAENGLVMFPCKRRKA